MLVRLGEATLALVLGACCFEGVECPEDFRGAGLCAAGDPIAGGGGGAAWGVGRWGWGEGGGGKRELSLRGPRGEETSQVAGWVAMGGTALKKMWR